MTPVADAGAGTDLEWSKMRFAIPCDSKNAAETIGKASRVAFLDVNPVNGHILWKHIAAVTQSAGDSLTQWLADHGTDMLLAADVSVRTREQLTHRGVQVACAERGADPETLVEGYLGH